MEYIEPKKYFGKVERRWVRIFRSPYRLDKTPIDDVPCAGAGSCRFALTCVIRMYSRWDAISVIYIYFFCYSSYKIYANTDTHRTLNY